MVSSSGSSPGPGSWPCPSCPALGLFPGRSALLIVPQGYPFGYGADGASALAPLPPSRPVSALSVRVETPSRLAAQVARLHHLHEQRRGAVLRILEALVQHVQHRELDIEPDHVAKRERADRVVAAELHRLVDLGGRGEPLAQRENR